MECKVFLRWYLARSSRVLIETLWNVKEDTDVTMPVVLPRINRNIVECKDALQSQLANCCCGINRNIVECKEELYNKGLVGTDGINRNIVECKVNTFSLEAHDIIVLIETLWNVKYFPLTI